MTLAVFNRLDRDDVRARLRSCVDIDRWINAIADARPFASTHDALDLARTAAHPWTRAEIDGALAHHPRIGERAAGHAGEAALSRAEQAGVEGADSRVQADLVAGNREYEEKFDRVFLIRAAGRGAGEILDQLNERLLHTPEDELGVVAGQLREIAVLRLEGVLN